MARVCTTVAVCAAASVVVAAAFQPHKYWLLNQTPLQSDRSCHVQGLQAAGLDKEQLQALLVDVTNNAGFGSIVAGEMPGMDADNVNNVLAEMGLLASSTAIKDEISLHGRWDSAWAQQAEQSQLFLFTSQHQRLSLTEMGIYDDHVAAAEDTDEDFFGHFS